eukprot:TRINITY_DN110928_c0_g1_i1.p1 TRINITY_DN110928_c0_g1~~TRINITY_DN110928_c0_g1_i1.p1  ORF type:complete len:913 (-),score=113.41 TRINITY_DN110928_c0_g1_i1:190-2928(-)
MFEVNAKDDRHMHANRHRPRFRGAMRRLLWSGLSVAAFLPPCSASSSSGSSGKGFECTSITVQAQCPTDCLWDALGSECMFRACNWYGTEATCPDHCIWATFHQACKDKNINEVEVAAAVEAAQERWANAFMKIVRIHKQNPGGQVHVGAAAKMIDELYGYDTEHPVLFAPAEATDRRFRTDRAGAISYFVGGNPNFPEDMGFALKGWNQVRFENAQITLSGGEAIAMGTYHFVNESHADTKLEYSFGYFRDAEGNLRINLHHGSYPYELTANETHEVGGITVLQLNALQQAWSDHLVEIGKYYTRGWSYRKRAKQLVDEMYAYDESVVLFKPTEAKDQAFRSTAEGALSYFIGGNGNFPEDLGFALKPWTDVRWANTALTMEKSTALAMGDCTFVAANGETYAVQFLLGVLKGSNGQLKINLHHSSLSRGGKLDLAQGQTTSRAGEITEADVDEAQRAWGGGIMAIGAQYAVGGDYRSRAEEFVDELYAYTVRPVCFKPAEALHYPFRLSRDSAISYFVGGDPRIPSDQGFAIRNWRSVRFANEEMAFEEGQALAMGNMFLAEASGKQVVIEYTMGYMRAADGSLHINLHHGSYPYKNNRHRKGVFKPVSLPEIEALQKQWAERVADLGSLSKNNTKELNKFARKMVEDLYGYGATTVLFRATDTSEGHFRLTTEGAASYFVGNSMQFPNDAGFALKPWKSVTFKNDGGVGILGDRAFAMGHYFFEDADGKVTTLEYTMGMFRDAEEKLRINVHFTSWPYSKENYAIHLSIPDLSHLADEMEAAGGHIAGGVKEGAEAADSAAHTIAGIGVKGVVWIIFGIAASAGVIFALFTTKAGPNMVSNARRFHIPGTSPSNQQYAPSRDPRSGHQYSYQVPASQKSLQGTVPQAARGGGYQVFTGRGQYSHLHEMI